ncbi:MAG: hypothetical protein IKC59_08855 [Clostridia bacterium]|nr:hypothetical protein [Clostridia bacterium]
MKKLKLISLLCSLIMVLGCFSVFPAFAASETDYDYAGSGTVADPYELTNKNFESFVEAAKTSGLFANTSFKLTEDIVLNKGDAAKWAEGTAIADYVLSAPIINYNYTGTFDGNNKTISGVCMISQGESYIGLFRCLHQNWRSSVADSDIGTVKNLRLVNSYFENKATSGQSPMGSIAAVIYGRATIENCYSDAIFANKSITATTVKDDQVAIGGIAGLATAPSVWDDPTISKCVFAGSIPNSIGGAGGILGWINASTEVSISNCLNLGSVAVSTVKHASKEEYAATGAIVGGVNWSGVKCTITNTMNLNPDVPYDVTGTTNHQNISVSNGSKMSVVVGLRAKNNSSCPNNPTAWVSGMYLSAFLTNGFSDWTNKSGYVPNPTTFDIPLTAIINADTLGLTTTGETTSVRLSSTNPGLRFETYVSDTGVELLNQLKTAGATVAMTTYISAAKYFTEASYGITEFTTTALDNGVEAGSRYLVVPAADYLRKNGNGDNTFAGSVVNINDKTMEYIARGALTVTMGTETYEIYAGWDIAERASVSAIATIAANDFKTVSGETGYGNEIIDRRTGNTVYSPYTQEKYDCILSLIAQ